MLVTDSKSAREAYCEIEFHGDPDAWICISKAAVSGHWMKSTKAMRIRGLGVLVQVTTEVNMTPTSSSIAEALTFIPGAILIKNEKGHIEIGVLESGMVACVGDE